MQLVKNLKLSYTMLTLSALCGGVSANNLDASSTPSFSQLVVFGDSLSDVGTYRVGSIAAIGGGRWTINSSSTKNWTELVASAHHLPQPCAAQTGLLSITPGLTGAPVNNFSNCRNYAQGSSRVTSPFGPLSHAIQQALTLNNVPASQNSGALGLLAQPTTTQMAQHLRNVGGTYSGTELVTVLVGANDIFMSLNAVSSAARANASTAIATAQFADWASLPNWKSIQASLSAPGTSVAVATAQQTAQSYMKLAATNLATAVKTQIIAKGAKHIAIINVPDISVTPYITSQNSLDSTALSKSLTKIFNATLQAELADTKVVFIDAFTNSQNQIANPAQHGLTNVTIPACSPTAPQNPLQGSSLTCTNSSTIAGVDTSNYLFADGVHPTPYGHKLLAELVINSLREADNP